MKGRSAVGTLAVPVDEGRLVTRWMRGGTREPSCHAGGGMMCNRDWLDAEKKVLAAKGVAVEIVENPAMPGYFALARA
jgi:hypothetical protein